MAFGRAEKQISIYPESPATKSKYKFPIPPSKANMYTNTQLFILSYLFASFGLALPVNPGADIERPPPVTEASASIIEDTKSPLDILSRGIEPEGIERASSALSEASDVETKATKNTGLHARANDPYNGQYAPDEWTRQQELRNIGLDLSPDGKTGRQLAREKGLPYDGDSGKREAAEIANGGPLPEICGEGCLNSAFSRGSKVCSTLRVVELN